MVSDYHPRCYSMSLYLISPGDQRAATPQRRRENSQENVGLWIIIPRLAA